MIIFWDTCTKQITKVLRGHQGSVLCLQYDDKILVSGSSDSRILVWDLVGEKGTGKGKWEIKNTLVGHSMAVLDLCLDQKWIVSCSKVSFFLFFQSYSPTTREMWIFISCSFFLFRIQPFEFGTGRQVNSFEFSQVIADRSMLFIFSTTT